MFYFFLTLPKWNKDDAIDDVELFQDAGHAGSSELENKGIPPLESVSGATERTCRSQCSHLEWHDAGVGAVLVDLIHGSLQSYGLLG